MFLLYASLKPIKKFLFCLYKASLLAFTKFIKILSYKKLWLFLVLRSLEIVGESNLPSVGAAAGLLVDDLLTHVLKSGI